MPENIRDYCYTQNHCLVCNTIERVFGELKGRWWCLGKDCTIHHQPTEAAIIIKNFAMGTT